MVRLSVENQLGYSIVKALLYYDLFDFPLTATEIFRNLPTNHVTQEDVDIELENLTRKTAIYRLGSFYSLQKNGFLEDRRITGNALAEKYMVIARKKARLISTFPFVESVMISGSLSKGFADRNSDIDFFVITRPNRLWIARTLLIAYRRIFLFNSHKFFCTNYFVTSDHLSIREKNLYTAIELSTLIPLYGPLQHSLLLSENAWIQTFLPNFSMPAKSDPSIRTGFFKCASEQIINLFFPEVLDRFFMKITFRHWKKKYAPFHSRDDFRLAFRTNRHVSKCHNNNFQKKVVSLYSERLRQFQIQ